MKPTKNTSLRRWLAAQTAWVAFLHNLHAIPMRRQQQRQVAQKWSCDSLIGSFIVATAGCLVVSAVAVVVLLPNAILAAAAAIPSSSSLRVTILNDVPAHFEVHRGGTCTCSLGRKLVYAPSPVCASVPCTTHVSSAVPPTVHFQAPSTVSGSSAFPTRPDPLPPPSPRSLPVPLPGAGRCDLHSAHLPANRAPHCLDDDPTKWLSYSQQQ